MIKYVCTDTEKFLDELLIVQRAIEKELRNVMKVFRNLLEKDVSKTPKGAVDGIVLAFGTFHNLNNYNPNMERIFKCVYSEC